MSVGHSIDAKPKPPAELYEVLGQGDTPKLYARPVKLDTDHDVPYSGGNSVDGRTVYIDRTLYADIMSGKIAVRGMTAKQIVRAITEHEHSEWAVDVGDNPVDVYQPAHEFAECKENEMVRDLGVDPDRYNAVLEKPVAAVLARDPVNPPRDLWCGPIVDHPDDRDRVLIRILKAKGVTDAFKASKFDTHYGTREVRCEDCKAYEKPGGTLSTCAKVCGMVRYDRGCDLYVERKK